MKTIGKFTLCAAGLALALAPTGCSDEGPTGTDSTVHSGVLGAANHLGVRVDRMGMPAIATAVITSKDAYNAADPADDANGDFVDEIVANLTAFHDLLDDDLIGLGLTPCEVGDCVSQAAPLVVPDVLTIDPGQPAGFPNGRRLADPVMDVTLAVVLLDLSVHPATALIGVNPTANDKPFLDDFPYLRPPNRSMPNISY